MGLKVSENIKFCGLFYEIVVRNFVLSENNILHSSFFFQNYS